RVAIARGEHQGLSAQESAVSVQGDSAFVFVLVTQGERTVAERRPVVTGERQQGYVELIEGVQAGDRIVADGLNKVQSGQTVKVVGQGSARPRAGAGGAPVSTPPRRPAA
ncbi:MAG: efflux transporter periplasmic adaptor subunit, partial [Phenylobacterium sp.]|nr:efflux transporter periplasmic adaptor subunit [Phenylobacterium sp.]